MEPQVVEQALRRALQPTHAQPAPPRLQEALNYAVFPGGARLRPRLCLAVAQAGPQPHEELAMATAVAVELLHCASLVHDDLPCFDDAHMRRDQPTVHRAFGQPLAVLVGDGLIMLAFSALHRVGSLAPRRVARIAFEVSQAATRLVLGQGWEAEPHIDINAYQRDKTAALFEAAAVGGALSAGAPITRWRGLGQVLGEAYQVADDIVDVAIKAQDSGKSAGRDAVLGRPNRVLADGLEPTQKRLVRLLAQARKGAGAAPGAALSAWLGDVESRLQPLTVLQAPALKRPALQEPVRTPGVQVLR